MRPRYSQDVFPAKPCRKQQPYQANGWKGRTAGQSLRMKAVVEMKIGAMNIDLVN